MLSSVFILREVGCDDRTIGAFLGHRTPEVTRKQTEKHRRTKLAIVHLDQACLEQDDNDRVRQRR